MSRLPAQKLAPRDSLELASLASSPDASVRSSVLSSPSGISSSRKLSLEDDDPLHAPAGRPGHARMPSRSYSISSAFDFAPPLFPLSNAGHAYTALGASNLPSSLATEDQALEKHKTLTYVNGLSLVIGLTIGSGIFSSPSQVNVNAGSPAAALFVWIVAGLLAWTGASSYIELGGAIPLNGGAQVYLTKIFGDATGFVFSWCSLSVLNPGSTAIIATIFGEYFLRAIIGAEAADSSPILVKLVAITGLFMVSLLISISTSVATRSADLFLFFKFIALFSIIVIAIVATTTGFAWNGTPSMDWKVHGWFEGTNSSPSNLAVALYAGLWAFDGWDNVSYVAGELVNPARDLPRVIHSSFVIVITAYLLANVSYFLVLPLSVTSTSTTIAVAFGRQVLGPIGSLIFALVVSGSCFGALNATIFTTTRLYYAAAKEGYMPSMLGRLGLFGNSSAHAPTRRISPDDGSGFGAAVSRMCKVRQTGPLFLTPIYAVILNFFVTSIYVILGDFRTLVTLNAVATYLFYFLTVLGLLVLRVREPNLERPYRCWITTPVIFCCVSLFLLSRSVVAEPLTSLAVFVAVTLGILVYFIKVRKIPAERQGDTRRGWRFWEWGKH